MQLRKCNVGSCIFSHFPLHLFWCRCIFVCIFSFFFRKKNTKVDQNCKKKATEKNATSQVAKKMQRRKCNVGSCIFFAFSVPLFLAFAFSVALLDFPDLLQLALWFCLEFSRQRMLLIEGGTATSLGAKDTSLRNCLAHCMSRFLLGNFKIRDVKLDKIVAFWGCIFLVFFPTCQVRVVRFCQSFSPPPPRLAVLLLLVLLLPL